MVQQPWDSIHELLVLAQQPDWQAIAAMLTKWRGAWGQEGRICWGC